MELNEAIEAHWKENGDSIQFKISESDSYDTIRGQLTKYAYGRLKDWMDAEDAVMEAYLSILTWPPKSMEGLNFGGLYKVVLDRAISDIKKKKFHREEVIQEDYNIENTQPAIGETTPSEDMPPDQTYDMADQISLIMDMTDKLKMKPKNIVRLAMIFGYSYKEISGIMKVDVKTIENTLNYFRKKLREHPDYDDLRSRP